MLNTRTACLLQDGGVVLGVQAMRVCITGVLRRVASRWYSWVIGRRLPSVSGCRVSNKCSRLFPSCSMCSAQCIQCSVYLEEEQSAQFCAASSSSRTAMHKPSLHALHASHDGPILWLPGQTAETRVPKSQGSSIRCTSLCCSCYARTRLLSLPDGLGPFQGCGA